MSIPLKLRTNISITEQTIPNSTKAERIRFAVMLWKQRQQCLEAVGSQHLEIFVDGELIGSTRELLSLQDQAVAR